MNSFFIFTFLAVLQNSFAEEPELSDGIDLEKCERNVSAYRPKRYIPDDYQTYESLDFKITGNHSEGFDVEVSWTMRNYQIVKNIVWALATNDEITPLTSGVYDYQWQTSSKLDIENSTYKIPTTLEYDSLYKFCMEYYEELAYIGYVRDAHLCYYLRLPGNETTSDGSFYMILGPVRNTAVFLSWKEYPEVPPEDTPKYQVYFVAYGMPGQVRTDATNLRDNAHKIKHLLRNEAYEFCLTQEKRVRYNKLGAVLRSPPLCAVIRTDDQLPGQPLIQHMQCHYDSYCSAHVCSVSWKIEEIYHERLHSYHINWINEDGVYPSEALPISKRCIERCNVTESVPFEAKKVCVLAKDIHSMTAESCYQPEKNDGSESMPPNHGWWALVIISTLVVVISFLILIFQRANHIGLCTDAICVWCGLLKRRWMMETLEETIEMGNVTSSLLE